ncbi:MAG TPA: cytochrome c oxidase subunit 4 [Chloroflexota bacterium]|nr:cytochrome c oxidase subunit 4 [Chloroflexota bacterium]
MQTSDDATTQSVSTDHPTAHPPEAAGVTPEHPVAEEHIHLPPPSIWPITTALGVALAGFGLVTAVVFSYLGLVVMAFGIVAWIQELRHEPH